LTNLGFRPGWGLGGADGELRLAIEVYPHPAMVRLFDIEERIPYKKGRAADRRRHFQELQGHLRRCLDAHFPKLERSDGLEELLDQPWSKPVEDRIDAVFCALIGYWHWLHVGRRSEVLGDLYTGFILVPKP
jgi:predicted RNase H-like nuclease